jgi:branched-chain amino acid transport system substrate-binding protein
MKKSTTLLFSMLIFAAVLALPACQKKEEPRESIKVGGIFDTSGATSDVGQDYAQAAVDAAKYINENGGVNGKMIELISNDYAYKVPEAVALYKKYKDQGIYIIQGWGTGDTNAMKELIQKDEIVYMSASYDSNLNDPTKTPYNFFVGTSYSDAIRLAMRYIKETWTESRPPRVVFIYPDHPYGKNPIPAGKAMAEELGFEVGPDENVALGAKDATSQLLSMKKFNPDWAWIGGTTASTAVILKDAAKLGLDTRFVINVWGFDENLAKLAGDAADEKAYGMAPFAMWGDDVPGMEAPMATHKKLHPDDEHLVRYIQGWTTMMVMWEAMKRADEAGDLSGPGLRRALETIKDFDTGGLTAPITFSDKDHRPNTSLKIYKISGGEMVPVKEVSIEREERFLGQ